jgi:hypothetical protein
MAGLRAGSGGGVFFEDSDSVRQPEKVRLKARKTAAKAIILATRFIESEFLFGCPNGPARFRIGSPRCVSK